MRSVQLLLGKLIWRLLSDPLKEEAISVIAWEKSCIVGVFTLSYISLVPPIFCRISIVIIHRTLVKGCYKCWLNILKYSNIIIASYCSEFPLLYILTTVSPCANTLYRRLTAVYTKLSKRTIHDGTEHAFWKTKSCLFEGPALKSNLGRNTYEPFFVILILYLFLTFMYIERLFLEKNRLSKLWNE